MTNPVRSISSRDVTNLFDGIPADLPDEYTQILAGADGVHIERIVSRGHVSPPGFWYDQDWTEWVCLISGEAELRLESPAATVRLHPGDHILLPAHCRHRVEWTAMDKETIWLAVHIGKPR